MVLRTRYPLRGNSPRDFILNNNQVIIPTFFSDVVHCFDLSEKTSKDYPLLTNRMETAELKRRKVLQRCHLLFSAMAVVQWLPPRRCTHGRYELGFDE